MSFLSKFKEFHGKDDMQGEFLSVNALSRKKFMRNKLAVASLIVLLVVFVISLLAPVIAPYPFEATDLLNARSAPTAEHLLGTDEYGRDILTRLLYGGRVSVTVALAAVGLQLLIGVTLGCLSGYFGGWVDTVIMRITDVFMCFPFYILAVCLAALVGAGLNNLILIIAFLSWMGICRIVRAEILSLKESDFILASCSLGLSSKTIILHHILPNVVSPILVAGTLAIAGAIMSEASMSFLSLGVQPPEASWGNMLTAAQSMQALVSEWWRWMPPGFMICIVVFCINYIGEGLREAFDPRS